MAAPVQPTQREDFSRIVRDGHQKNLLTSWVGCTFTISEFKYSFQVLKDAENLAEIVKSGGGRDKKVVVGKIFGSNLRLHEKVVVVTNHGKSPNPSGSIGESPSNTQWAALSAARQLPLDKSSSFVMVWLYNAVRTYFQSQI